MFRFNRKAALLLAATVMLAGCQANGGGDLVYQRSIAELNQKARQMMEAGDYAGAVARLESAHDLEPDNVKTHYNLAIAYQMKGDYDKAIQAFTALVDKPGLNQAEIQKSLGIAHEAKGDQVLAQAREAEGGEKPAEGEAAIDPTRLTDEAVAHYQLAIEHYQKALPGLEKSDDVQMQIEALQQKVRNPADLLTG